MTTQHKPRYVTRAINEKLNIEIKVLLWKLLDSIEVKRKDKMDYLQVFEIVNQGNNIKIINRQEQPAMTEELMKMKQGSMNIEDTIVWIIDDLEYRTMLFPKDY
ncbi:DUF960 family protein [Terribacillus sp. JSM ZJ617]|uniref:DUF960 family protein n=1 Tax=Terribacillus sp. JSM ZJ617 TaxID=3342119 RepID=UPI0035A8A119